MKDNLSKNQKDDASIDMVTLYCNQKLPACNEKRTLELFKAYRETGDGAVYEEIFRTNMGLVKMVAGKYRSILVNYPAIGMEDLLSEGNIGLIRAINKYDEARGAFSTCAVVWIRQAIERFLYNSADMRFPYHVVSDYLKIIKNIKEKYGANCAISQEDIKAEAELMGLTPYVTEQICRYVREKDMVRFDEDVVNEKEGDAIGPLSSVIEDKDAVLPEEEVLKKERAELIGAILEKELTPMQVRTIRDYFGLEGDAKNTREISEERECTHQNIASQLTSAMRRLRSPSVKAQLKKLI